MVSPNTHMENPFTPLFFGGFHGITEEGIPRFIQDKYEEVVSRALWFTYNGLWTAAASGIGKGIIAVTALAAGMSALTSAVFTEGAIGGALMTGAGEGIAALGSLGVGLPLLAIGAASGAIYEVSNRQQEVAHDLAKTRAMFRSYLSEQQGKDQAQAAPEVQPMQSAAPEQQAQVNQPQGYWASKIAAEQARQQAQAYEGRV